MRFTRWGSCTAGMIVAFGIAGAIQAQPPGRPGRGQGDGNSVEAALKKLQSLDTDGDGKIVIADVKDQRLQPLLKRADADGDGTVTKEELTAQVTKESANVSRAGGVRPAGGPGGPGGGPGGPGAGGPGGPGGGPGGFGGPPQPGQVLPPFLQDELQLTEAQRRELQELQKDVDSRLGKILTSDQQQQLRQMQTRGPGGPGGPGGGFGGPGGAPPAGGRTRPQR